MAYFSNGSEGGILEDQCEDCPLGDGWDYSNPEHETLCPVQDIQLQYNYDQCAAGQEKLRDAMNLLINQQGECQVRKQLVSRRGESEAT